MIQRRDALRLTGGLAVLGAMSGLLACTESKPSFAAVDITGADYAKDFQLTDHTASSAASRTSRARWWWCSSGYTQCPDVCPTSMAELAQVKKQLGADGDKLQGLFITVDPERDTPEVLKAYMTNFDPTFLALSAPADKLAATAKDFKVYYKKVDGKTATSYTMDHSAGSYVYDTRPAAPLRPLRQRPAGAGNGHPAVAQAGLIAAPA